MITEGKIYTVPEICELLGFHRDTVIKLIKNGNLPAFRCGTGKKSQYRIIGKNLINYMEGK
jgi:excisionase family DNA binding protein